METAVMVGTAIGARTVAEIRDGVRVDSTQVHVVRFDDGSFGVVTSGDRVPDLWPMSEAAADVVMKLTEFRGLFLDRTSGSLHHHVRFAGVRHGRRFTVKLYFGMWPEHQRADEVAWH